ncbi:MAG: hypothetical protein U5L75_01260 [Candidatus Campbellbacteria bacterium]|nr:hypothetical protein [Candidatus Campbellbacteria bacterium]
MFMMFGIRQLIKADRKNPIYLSPLVLGIIFVASVLIFIFLQMTTAFAEREDVRKCHADSLSATETLPEDVNAAEYYEFSFKTCMRGKGYAI